MLKRLFQVSAPEFVSKQVECSGCRGDALLLALKDEQIDGWKGEPQKPGWTGLVLRRHDFWGQPRVQGADTLNNPAKGTRKINLQNLSPWALRIWSLLSL